MSYQHKLSTNLVFSTVLFLCVFTFVLANENDESEDEYEYDRTIALVTEDQQISEQAEKISTDVQNTETVKVSDTVTKEITTIIKKDRDGDGVFDEQDQFPDINDHFIVKDDNNNGIVDTYEK